MVNAPSRVQTDVNSDQPHSKEASSLLDAQWLRRFCLDAGADDVGFVEAGRPELENDREDLLLHFPHAKTLISLVIRMNREPIRSPARSIANLEFHHAGNRVNEIAHWIVKELEAKGIRAVNPAMGFPMEMDRFPGKIWIVSHKTVAVAAGLGKMGIHRNVIHPRFGNFILLGTVLMDARVTATHTPIDYDPCLECKLCVAACPVGAIGQDGYFNFSACYTHNYREFMGGFTDWVERITESRSAREYRRQVSDPESVSMWQSLSFGANYKAAYCMAVCPAGEDVIQPFTQNRNTYLTEFLRPLQAKQETLYVVSGSDAETHAAKRFPHKPLKPVRQSLRPRTIQGFLDGLPLLFQPHRSEGLEATFHFTFFGNESRHATVVIKEKSVHVFTGHRGHANFHVLADGQTWLGFLACERNLLWAILRRKIRFRGSLTWLKAFARCFPMS